MASTKGSALLRAVLLRGLALSCLTLPSLALLCLVCFVLFCFGFVCSTSVMLAAPWLSQVRRWNRPQELQKDETLQLQGRRARRTAHPQSIRRPCPAHFHQTSPRFRQTSPRCSNSPCTAPRPSARGIQAVMRALCRSCSCSCCSCSCSSVRAQSAQVQDGAPRRVRHDGQHGGHNQRRLPQAQGRRGAPHPPGAPAGPRRPPPPPPPPPLLSLLQASRR
jgi:hypothetical protein